VNTIHCDLQTARHRRQEDGHDSLPTALLESWRMPELVDQQSPQVQEVFQFMLAVAMEESGAPTVEQRVFPLGTADVYRTKGSQARYSLHQEARVSCSSIALRPWSALVWPMVSRVVIGDQI
jgi:hypothetical protein